jgi:hypothetical protein
MRTAPHRTFRTFARFRRACDCRADFHRRVHRRKHRVYTIVIDGLRALSNTAADGDHRDRIPAKRATPKALFQRRLMVDGPLP